MRRAPLSRPVRWIGLSLALAAVTACSQDATGPAPTLDATAWSRARASIGIDVGLSGPLTPEMATRLSAFGTIAEQIPELNVVLMTGSASAVSDIAALPFVLFAEPDAQVSSGPLDAELASDFTGGLGTWDQDAVNVSQPGLGHRTVSETGAGVYVGVLDTGLLHTWRLYFPEERIATQYAAAFSGGWHPNAANPETPNVWEHDVNAHGTHVTSTILGYDLGGTPIGGVAPQATVIPVKVLGQNGLGWSSTIAQGLVYLADLETGPLAGHPMVANMSLGGGPSALENLAIDYAIARGVIVVAAAGNGGTMGMDYPAAYAPVISVGSLGWGDCTMAGCVGQWTSNGWWYAADVPEPGAPFYVSTFSSRQLPGQDLDVLAPGDWVVGPYQINRSAHADYYYLSGTSMATPHAAGIVALMAEKDPGLTAAQAEAILEASATPLAPGTRHPLAPGGVCCEEITWGSDATGSGFITADAALALTPP